MWRFSSSSSSSSGFVWRVFLKLSCNKVLSSTLFGCSLTPCVSCRRLVL